MTTYALATVSAPAVTRQAALVIDEQVAPLDRLAERFGAASLLRGASVLSLLERWEEALPQLDALAEAARSATDVDWLPVDAVQFHAPVDLPRQIFCTGANYRTHVVQMMVDTDTAPEGVSGDAIRTWAEKMMDERLANGEPYVFTKPLTTVAGPNDPLTLPTNTTKPDWELELAVVIGKGGLNISREDAMAHVAGYAIVNDVSARDLIPRTDYKLLGTDWLRAKGQEGFLPFGPYLVPRRFVADPYDLNIRLSVDGQLMQNESTSDMMFDIARQIEYISRYSRLLPGDVICTGSPAGNGTHYNRYLRDGDVMVGEIDGLGRQTIRCVAAQA
ncbi:2-keto-4-pentenoate hydratase/2-oxohepta-3-ene-1,7-dioic acid hydratase in catechol pathway [Novosphingobium chloroacetimidivorans]|uniref:2-keto-4-pentenoate hydratase/2-oxohepta-3-ene-1,7-dioic acid hydratase in catechol pathway n=1 Tax=Novosphingobium chloroacetimidivorans TaxID=1428314 RepID=A0A7W7NVU4_9SPHN|nr:fumarylacetoacetate hydrolase family protein [Novosphingobium chloroacetimidivorans]MBB4858651.1 2-keto-4-pentenoate hydratase/2-oxohepta-3-ene-1,7-dioic acid hydratase in catechol pathway [Novosphingobium chloroacetimidivorans]